MTRSPIALLAFVLLCLAAHAGASLHAADVNLRATLIHGSNSGGGVDGQLRQYERNLKRVLGFDTFKQQGSGSASLSTPGSANISMGGGHVVTARIEEAGDGKLRIAARWTQGGQAFINTTVVAAPNQPTVLVGPSAGDGKLILLLVAR